MATYEEWNKAIAEYFVSGLPSGATVYLSVEEEVLMEIGTRFEQLEDDYVNWVEDFTEAVKSKCVIGNEIYLPRDVGYQSDQVPNCVAFLAAMVLAAHYMIGEEIENETILQTNYFTRLRQVLDLSDEETGRPEGLLPAGIEENLWQTWNRWLISNGWLYSAEHGQANYNKFINYPLSQALLREGDKIVIENLLRQKEKLGQLSRVWDREVLGSWVRRQQFSSKYLGELIQESDFRRYEAITDAVYDVYISIDWDQDIPETQLGGRSIKQRRLIAQLYREEDPIMESIIYYLYPRQHKYSRGKALEVIQNRDVHSLREQRQGWFMPLWSVNPTGGMFYEVRGHPQIKELVLPERKFWILVRDPEDETSGIFAGWGQPGLGETFILLCRKEYEEQMEFFKDEALLNWDHSFPIDEEWIEYRECKIISRSWEGIIPQRQDLYDELKPNVSATISLKGGLRVPNQGGWLQGYAPEITVIAFDDNVELKLLNTSDPNKLPKSLDVNVNEPIGFPSDSPGDYLLEVYISRKLSDRRVCRIIPWETIVCRQPEQPFLVDVGKFTLQGAIIKVIETERQEGE